LLEAGIVEPEETTISRQPPSKDVTIPQPFLSNRYARNNRGTVGSGVFY
jgi:hypothetical protein